MEQRICGRPFLHAAHHLYLRFVRVQRPLAERVKKYIRGHGRGEYHHTPLERAVLRLFTVAKLYSAESGESDIQRAAESACAHQGIIQAEIITQKAADNAQNQLRPVRKYHKQRAYDQHDGQRNYHGYPVELPAQRFSVCFHSECLTMFYMSGQAHTAPQSCLSRAGRPGG